MAHANRKQISLFVTEEELEKLNKYSKEIGISRQKLLENLLGIGFDELEAIRKYGLLSIGLGVRALVRKLKNKGIDPSTLADDSDDQS